MKKLTKLQVLKKKALFAKLALLSMDEKSFNLEEYNKAIRSLNDFIADTKDEMQNYFDERTEKWQESDNGFLYQNWIDNWDIEFQEVNSFKEVEKHSESDLQNEP